MPNLTPRALAAAVALTLPSTSLFAQTPPDAGQLLREAERAPLQAPATPPLRAAPAPAAPAASGPTVQVAGFRLTGVTLVPEAELQASLAEFVGRPASLDDLARAADAVARRYQQAGFLVRAFLPQQAIRDGVVTIEVLEGRLGAVRVVQAPPARAIGEAQVRSIMTARQAVGAPVRADDVQRAITLLDALPGVAASSMLEPGDRPGETRLVVNVQDEPLLGGHAQLDNAGSHASGEARLSGGLSLNSPTGRGDQVQLYGSKSRGSAYGSLAYSLPVGADGLRASLSLSRLSYGYALSSTRYSGGAGTWGLALSYPLLRRTDLNLGLNASHERKTYDNAVAGVQLNDKSITLTTVGLGGDATDGWFGGGITQFSLALSRGRLDLGGNAADLAADQAAGGPGRQGGFGKLAWSLARVQRLSAVDTLQLSLSGQNAEGNLDSAEKFGATGLNGVRAYGSSEPSGDDGALATIEWRRQFGDRLSVAVFRDEGWLRRDHRAHAGTLSPNRYRIAGHGLGLNWGRADTLLVRASVAWREGANPVRNPGTGADSDGTHRNPRVHVSLVRSF